MAERSLLRRTGDCRVKLDPDMLERLEKLAKAYGFPVATMAAMAIGEWVNGKEQSAAHQRMLMVDVGRRIAGDLGQMFQELSESPEALEQVNAAWASQCADQTVAKQDGVLSEGGFGIGGSSHHGKQRNHSPCWSMAAKNQETKKNPFPAAV